MKTKLLLLILLMGLSSCMGTIPANQAIVQDVANDSGVAIQPQANSMMAASTATTHESASAQKAKAFWGN